MSMEKFGVVTEKADQREEKKASDSRTCPSCGSAVSVYSGVKMCPNCGTAPFEGLPQRRDTDEKDRPK